MNSIASIARRTLLVAAVLQTAFIALASALPVYAQSATPSGLAKPSGIQMELPALPGLSSTSPSSPSTSSSTASSTPSTFVRDIYMYVLGIVGSIAVIMIIYGGVKYIAQPGNTAARSDALDIIKNCIWGIALLAGAFLILSTINMDLVSLHDPDLRTVAIPVDQPFNQEQYEDTSSGGLPGNTSNPCTVDTDTTKGTVDRAKVIDLAKQVLKADGIILSSSGGDCGSATTPYSIVQAVANEGLPPVCDNLTKDQCQKNGCPQGGSGRNVTLCPQLLQGILKANKMVKDGEMPPFRITSLTGSYQHAKNSGHYKGMKMDVVPTNDRSTPIWVAIHSGLVKIFGEDGARCEYAVSGEDSIFRPCLNINDKGTSNQHIDVQAGGGGSLSLDDVGKYGDEITKLASDYLKMGPRLKNNGTYGIPPDSVGNACGTPGIDPLSIVKAVADGKKPVVCVDSQSNLDPDNKDQGNTKGGQYAYCRCSVGGRSGETRLSKEVLQLLTDMEVEKDAGRLPDFLVVALTGGIQKWEGASSNHYSGTAFDIVPMVGPGPSQVRDDWEKLATFVEKKNYDVRYEYLRIVGGILNKEYAKYYETPNIHDKVLLTWNNGKSQLNMEECFSRRTNVDGGSGPVTTLVDLMSENSDRCFDLRIHVNAYAR